MTVAAVRVDFNFFNTESYGIVGVRSSVLGQQISSLYGILGLVEHERCVQRLMA